MIKPPDGTYAVVGFDRKGFICHRCEFARHSCSHINSLAIYIKEKEESLPDFIVDMMAAKAELQQSEISSRFPRTMSTPKISWVTTPKQRKIYELTKRTLENVLPDGTMALIPNNDPCSQCGGEMSDLVQSGSGGKRLFLWASVVFVTGKHNQSIYLQIFSSSIIFAVFFLFSFAEILLSNQS